MSKKTTLTGLNVGGDEYDFVAPDITADNIIYEPGDDKEGTSAVMLKKQMQKYANREIYNEDYIENTYNHADENDLKEDEWKINLDNPGMDEEDAQITLSEEIDTVLSDGKQRKNRHPGYHAIQYGELNAAKGAASTALGLGTIAEKVCSFAGGVNSHADGAASFTFGLGNRTNWIGAVSMGVGNTAGWHESSTVGGGKGSIALGESNTAVGRASAAIGSNNETKRNSTGSVALGFDTHTTTPVQGIQNNNFPLYGEVVIGKFSTLGELGDRMIRHRGYTDKYGTPVFTIGGGTSTEHRVDLCTVYASKNEKSNEGFLDASNLTAVFKDVKTVNNESRSLEWTAQGIKLTTWKNGTQQKTYKVNAIVKLKRFQQQGVLRIALQNVGEAINYEDGNSAKSVVASIVLDKNTKYGSKTFANIVENQSINFYFKENINASYQTIKYYNNFRLGKLNIDKEGKINATIGGNDGKISKNEYIMIWDIPVYFTE